MASTDSEAEALLEAALQYAELGYRVFPCEPGGKRPATPNGCLDATGDAEQIERWWASNPAYNVAIATDGLLVLDIDGANNPWLDDDPDRKYDLISGNVCMTPRGGTHTYFKGGGYRNTAGTIAPNVDTRGDGGYVLAPPSAINGIGVYQWVPCLDLDCGPSALREAPPWLLDLLEARAPVRLPATSANGNAIPSGQRNNTLARLAGGMRRMGLGEQEILASLRGINIARCSPPVDDSEISKIAWSVARYEPDQCTVAVIEDHWGQMDDAPTDEELAELDDRPTDPGGFPADLLKVGGLMGEVIDFTLAGAHKPQPVLALAGAVALMAVIVGRKVMDQFGTRPNMYLIGVAPSGTGKERPRQALKTILETAGLGDLIGPEEIASDAGLRRAVEERPTVLMLLDEVGWFLQGTNNAGRSPHLASARALLLKLYSSSSTTFCGKAFADRGKTVPINQPCVVVFGTSVPGPLFDGLGAGAFEDGLASRLNFFEGGRNPTRQDEPSLSPPSAAIVEAVKAWGKFSPGGNLADVNPQPFPLPLDADAKALFRMFNAKVDAILAGLSDEVRRGPWVRTGENARKLALVHACSLHGPDVRALRIKTASAEWGIRLAEFLSHQVAFLAGNRLASNQFERDRNEFREFVRNSPEGRCTKRETKRKFKRLRGREWDELVEAEVSAGFLRLFEEQRSGRKTTWVRCV